MMAAAEQMNTHIMRHKDPVILTHNNVHKVINMPCGYNTFHWHFYTVKSLLITSSFDLHTGETFVVNKLHSKINDIFIVSAWQFVPQTAVSTQTQPNKPPAEHRAMDNNYNAKLQSLNKLH